MTEKLQQLSGLLTDFRQLPELETAPPTLFEIAGYPHYEEVCSNILAFYFDSDEDHGLDNLLLRSLLEMIPDMESDFSSEQTNDVIREALTLNSKRIDLIIKTDSYCIAIENKIYAELYNDLNEYARHVKRISTEKHKPLKIVLSLNGIDQAKLTNGFIHITYQKLFKAVHQNIGFYIQNGSDRYIRYLLDFIQSIENLKGKTMDSEILEFFKDNYDEIQELFEYQQEINNQRHERVKKIANHIDDLDNSIHQGIWRKYTLVHDIELPEGPTVAIDYKVKLNGTAPEVFIRDNGGIDIDLRSLHIYKSGRFDTSLKMDNRRHKEVMRIKDDSIFNFEAETLKVAKALKEILSEIKLNN
ncbi:MAG TPA: PD-(D/E)XK nuclease family protein [Balneolaceae bacterium]|nr:PD-(D/E)XK nuclease family protein [Balneolaceae bacterium]